MLPQPRTAPGAPTPPVRGALVAIVTFFLILSAAALDFPALTGALGRLLVTVERYPDLKSNQNFLALQSQLEGTENRIAVARRDYIEAVRQYNTELRTFPGVIWASTVYRSAKPMETFTVAEDLKRPPTVKF